MQFERAIDHVMPRGDDRRDIVADESDRRRPLDYHLSPAELARTGHHAWARGVAAWLGRRSTSIGSAELSRQLGYHCRPECLAGILRRLESLGRGGEVEAMRRQFQAGTQ